MIRGGGGAEEQPLLQIYTVRNINTVVNITTRRNMLTCFDPVVVGLVVIVRSSSDGLQRVEGPTGRSVSGQQGAPDSSYYSSYYGILVTILVITVF